MLEARGIFRAFGSRPVLQGVNLSLPPGMCLGLAGGNGSGKSTLMRILAQVIRPDKGDILADGASVLGSRSFLRRRMGYVPQEDGLCVDLTVRQQMNLWRSAVEEACPEVDALLELSQLEGQVIARLSGGQRKRVSIAMALQSRPDYLLLDEAFSALDSTYRTRLEDWLRLRVEQGMAILWCSHDREELNRMCSRQVTLADGQLVQGDGALA